MLRVHQSTNAGAAKSYYTEGLSKEDYYSEGQEVAGLWGGQAAERMGLSGTVEKEDFHALVENRHPGTGERLTPRTKANRTIGYDFTFSVPKSVSVLHEHTQDDRILKAFQNSVRETMQDVEAEMKTQVTEEDGSKSERETGNMVWADFTHFTARPVDGEPDPHLHMHVFTFNTTWDDQEQRFKAGQFRDLKRDAPYWEAAQQARMAKALNEMGYAVERRGRAYEVAGVPDSVVEKFSRRTAEIDAKAKELGISDDRQKDGLGARMRQGKAGHLGRDDLRKSWDQRLSHEERLRLWDVSQGRMHSSTPEITSREATNYALNHTFERVSVEDSKRVKAEALRYGVGSVTVEGVQQSMKRPEVIETEFAGRKVMTTKEVLAEERQMIRFARDGRGTVSPLKRDAHQFERDFLSDEQKGAVNHVLTSTDRVTAIRGGAGVGKTTLMKEAVEAMEANGHRVRVFAPSADASRDVLRREGFSDSNTVAKLLDDPREHESVSEGVIWVDEAGQLGTRNMNQLFQLAEKQNARVILSGDVRQHGSVDRGDALRVLENQAGIQPAEIKEIRRQRGQYKQAVGDISEGRVLQGFDQLDELGYVKEVENGQRHHVIANDYLKAVDDGKTALVVSPTHAEGAKVTGRIREGLRDRGRLSRSDREYEQLAKTNFTDAQKADVLNYREGHVVQFSQNVPGFRRGSRVQVVERQADQILVCNEQGEQRPLPLQHADRYDLFESKSLPLSAGDDIRITRNGYTTAKNRLNNGSIHKIKSIDNSGNLVTDKGWTIPSDYGHLAHGYVTTSHASQGKTVDRVFLAQGSESFTATNREQFYVATSRGREEVSIYTDDKQRLRHEVTETSHRLSATEVAADPIMEKEQQARRDRELEAGRRQYRQAQVKPKPPRDEKNVGTWAEKYGSSSEGLPHQQQLQQRGNAMQQRERS